GRLARSAAASRADPGGCGPTPALAGQTPPGPGCRYSDAGGRDRALRPPPPGGTALRSDCESPGARFARGPPRWPHPARGPGPPGAPAATPFREAPPGLVVLPPRRPWLGVCAFPAPRDAAPLATLGAGPAALL